MDVNPESKEILFTIFSSCKVYPRPEILFLPNFLLLISSICRFTEAKEIKKNIENDSNHIDTEIFVIKPPATILSV